MCFENLNINMYKMHRTMQFFHVKIKYKNKFTPSLPSFLELCNYQDYQDPSV